MVSSDTPSKMVVPYGAAGLHWPHNTEPIARMRPHYYLLATLGMTLAMHDLHAGGPVNNLCGSPTIIAMTSVCMPTSGSTDGATQSYSDACAGDPNDDVWYQFTATNEVAIIEVFGSSGFDAVVEMWIPPCTDQNSVGCADETANGGDEFLVFDDLTVGDDYLIRIYHYQTAIPSTSTFQICVHGPPPNDACDGAQPLTMQPNCVPVNGDAEWATGGFSGIGCQGNFDSNDEVWFSFTATSGDVQITVDGDGNTLSGYDAVVNLFYTSGCSSMSQLSCAHATGKGGTEVLTFQGIVIGNTYHVAVHHAGPDEQQTSTFTICVQELGGGIGIVEAALEASDWSARVPGIGRPAELYLSRAVHGPTEVSVLDATGRWVHQQSFKALAMGTTALDWVPTSAGVYLVRLERNGVSSITRVVAQ